MTDTPPVFTGEAGGSSGVGGKRAGRRAVNLQTWLVVIIIVVSSVGLVASALATTAVMREVLLQRVDADLTASVGGWTQDPDIYQSAPAVVGPPSEFAVLRIDPSGNQQWINASDTRPNFGDVDIEGGPTTVDSLPGSVEDVEWRAMGVATPLGVTIVAQSLEREDAMLGGLMAVQIFISLIVLVIMALVGAWFIRRALAPLREVESTARAISGGEFDRRVPDWSPETEVGQLSRSLNIMLARLQTSIDTSREKEEQMRRFIGDASHELRTPLTSVSGYAELYRSGATQDADKVLGKIEEESGRMKLLVEDLLALTRAEGSRLELKPVDLLELVMSARSSARAAFAGREITVVNDVLESPVVNGDRDRLHQVLINLISNALRHGGEEATVQLRLSTADRDAVIEVIDDGRGISPEAIPHIFERFYREDASRTRTRGAGGGSGLGLSIVKSLVEQHGGTIVVTSVQGEGTVFRIRLPRLLNPATAER